MPNNGQKSIVTLYIYVYACSLLRIGSISDTSNNEKGINIGWKMFELRLTLV
jgi:hypothetical protein